MRIAFLCKRRYMGKDVIEDRYARLYEIPFQLARLGHTVHGFCLSYQGHEQGEWQHDAAPGTGTLTWESRSLSRLIFPALAAYPRVLRQRLRTFAPELLIGASDIPHVAFTARLADQLDVPYAIDLYDNFEGFGQARIPGMKTALRRAVRRAPLVTTTSDALASMVRDQYRAQGKIIAIPSTIDRAMFQPQDRELARQRLGLPAEVRLVGTAGGLHADKGVGTLYQAWRQLAADGADIHLVLAGPKDHRLAPPSDPRVHYLGELAHTQMPALFSALDVGVIYLRDTAFGRYCFPQKASGLSQRY